ncbi:MAG: hypothetical protein K8E66_08305, partial [Phycisphaerales bacterium]|nr:hypothetical protein [Phycisphaerales bacterium]
MIFRVLFIIVLATTGPCANADSITLRRTVTVEPSAPITLGQIADLEGQAAGALAHVVLIEDPGTLPIAGAHARRLGVSVIRERLEAEPGVNWAFLSLRGQSVWLVPPALPVEFENSAEQVARLDTTEPPEQNIMPGTIRAVAHGVLLKILRVEADDLRVRWPDRHDEFLDEPVNGRLIHVQPIGKSARVPLSITVYDGDRIEREETVRAELRVRRSVYVISRAAARGTRLTAQDTTARVLWLDPGVAPVADALDQVTTRRLEPGSVIEVGDIEPPLVIERGETISLRCIAGAVML